ncbi:hypothetical protein EYD10_05560, partial [Varanus komodoensis]
MHQMDCEFSFEVEEVTYLEAQCPMLQGTEPWDKSMNLIGKGDKAASDFSSCATPTPAGMEIDTCPNIIARRQGLQDNDPHLLKIPSVEYDDGDILPYQFDRHAPGRISTSPTLRRIRNNQPSIAQAFPLQNGTKRSRTGKQSLQADSFLPACASHASCSQHFNSSTCSMLTRRENSVSLEPLSIIPQHGDDHADNQTLDNTRNCSSSFLPEGKQNSQEQSQELDLHKPSGY